MATRPTESPAAPSVSLVLVDGTFELFRCFHGAPRHHDASGREVGAARGLLYTFASLLRKGGFSNLAVAFDAMASPSRRPADSESGALIRSQYPLALDVVRALGITVWPVWRFSADDAMATGAARFKRDPCVDQIVLATTDTDLAQCVEGERVVLLDRIRKRVTDEAGVRERFGVAPRQVPAYLALVGDPSDGLPGIPGWGRTSTAAVLAQYPTIEAIPDDAGDWDVEVRGAARLAAALRERRLEAILYRNLSRLRTDVPIPHTLEDLAWKGPDREALAELVDRLEAPEVTPWVDEAASVRPTRSA